jgi:hypothetical protein
MHCYTLDHEDNRGGEREEDGGGPEEEEVETRADEG